MNNVKNNELDRILHILSNFPNGASLQEIAKGLPNLGTRTLQRRLKTLTETGKITTEGNARRRTYKLSNPNLRLRPEKGASFHLSKKALAIRSKISLPVKSRKHVAYRRSFLDSYKPNSTFYLSEPTRKKLWNLGATNGASYPSGTYARQIFHRLLVDLAWNSSRLEGNTYSLLETERLIDSGILAEGKTTIESQMIINHKAAIEFLIELESEPDISRFVIKNIHALLADNLLADSACGALRKIPVGIQQSVYQPLGVPQLIEEIFCQIIDTAVEIEDPFEQAFFLMVHLPYLQPFEDVNKRTSRLAANIPLIRNNLVPLSFIDVPNKVYIDSLLSIYELNNLTLLEELFVWAYQRSCFLYADTRNLVGEPDKFRLQHRTKIIRTVGDVVQNKMNKVEAIALIRKNAAKFEKKDEADRFIEIVERELQSLHEGNIARYRIRPSEFVAWTKVWC
ncbi:MAG: Fic family protein (plasmid) [Candidatus Algichlamydia australiensis]|nr:Fic family protein [Chlamydiales bacterium]